MTIFKAIDEKFICNTCKKSVNKFLIDGSLINEEYMSGITFQVIKDEQNKPICFGVTPSSEEKFSIFNLGYWFKKCREECLRLEYAVCYECRDTVAIWGYGRSIDRRVTNERTTNKREDVKEIDRLHKSSKGSLGKAIHINDSSKRSTGIRDGHGEDRPV